MGLGRRLGRRLGRLWLRPMGRRLGRLGLVKQSLLFYFFILIGFDRSENFGFDLNRTINSIIGS
jgi:hypothetical protein